MARFERKSLIKEMATSRYFHFVRLARLDKPGGSYLLLWPTLSALWLASRGWPCWHLFLVFTLGTLLTRSAGCVVNDIADRKFDGLVKRTMDRPIPSGDIKVSEALIFMSLICLLALLLVATTNLSTVLLAFLGATIAGIYPYMKRYTYMPQIILGIAFSFGIPMAFTAVNNDVNKLAGLLFIANLIWIVSYDTEYAMVDRDDDLKIGLKSSAILFGDLDKFIIGILQLGFISSLLLVWKTANLHWPFLIGILIAVMILSYQQILIKERRRDRCLKAFLINHWLGLILFLSIVLDLFFYTEGVT